MLGSLPLIFKEHANHLEANLHMMTVENMTIYVI
jgi:hypothetical protein